jgi:uncharacterized membrane protein
MMSDSKGDRGMIIQNASALVLRIGVFSSAIVMLIGIAFSFRHGTADVARMRSDGFDINLRHMCIGIIHGRGKSIIEAGILMLVLTPIMRVAASMILFAFAERDWLYAAITLGVLILTLTGLLLL